MTAIEDLLVNCETCHVTGMVDGERCPACDGRGLVARPMTESATTDLEDLRKAELVELAESQGLDSSGTKADIIARIQEAGAAPD